MFKNGISVIASVFMSASAFGQGIENYTQEFVEYFDNHWSGSTGEGSKTWDHTSCILRNPINGACSEWIGHKTKGEASAKIQERTRQSGEMRGFTNPLTGNTIIDSNVSVLYRFEGATIGRNYAYPSGTFVGHEWGWLNPEGNVTVTFSAREGRNYELHVYYRVDGDNNDRPNRVVEAAVYGMRHHAKNIVTNFLRSKGSYAEVSLGH